MTTRSAELATARWCTDGVLQRTRSVPGGVPTAEVVTSVCEQLALSDPGAARRSMVVSFPARTRDGGPVFVRVGPLDPRALVAADELRGSWFRTPRLFEVPEACVGGVVVPVELWEQVAAASGPPFVVGRAAALLEASVPSSHVRPFDPFERCAPDRLLLDESVVSRADVAELFDDAHRRWSWWCERYRSSGWTHGDWNESNMSVCADGSFFVFDLGDAGSGPVGFDAACMAAQARFTRTAGGSVDAALAGYAELSPVPVAEVVGCLEPVAALVIAARVVATDDPVRSTIGSLRLASLAAERRGARPVKWLSLADALAEAAGEEPPEVP